MRLRIGQKNRHFASGRPRFQKLLQQDVVGYEVNATSGVLYNLDEAIMNMISSENDSISQLRECVEIDEDLNIGKVLLAFELLRNPPLATNEDGKSSREEVLGILSDLERNYENLDMREKYLGGAALAWFHGNYSSASSLLESCAISKSTGDILSLKLAQDCYIAMGDSQNALSCITRSMHTLDDTHFLHGHLMGMLATGYLENGKYSDAEEISTRSIARTKGRDLVGLHALLSTLQMTGRSSELLAFVEEYERKEPQAGTGFAKILFNKGCAHIQRGNYRGATAVYNAIMEISAHGTSSSLCNTNSLKHATLLLWAICLNAPSTHECHTHWKDPVLTDLWGKADVIDPIHAVCKIMVLSASLSEKDMIDPEEQISIPDEKDVTVEEVADSSSNFDGVLKWITTFNNKNNNSGDNSEDDSKVITKHVDVLSDEINVKKYDKDLVKQMLENHMQKSHLDYGAESMKDFPLLSKTKTIFNLETRSPEMIAYIEANPTLNTDRTWLYATCAKSIEESMNAFSNQNYDIASTKLNICKPVLSRIGGNAVQRDIINQTMIDSYIRADKFVEAQLLLCERTTVSPNEAQSWRRLATVFGKTGKKDLAEIAHYTSWQLGIGQGGFGGAK